MACNSSTEQYPSFLFVFTAFSLTKSSTSTPGKDVPGTKFRCRARARPVGDQVRFSVCSLKLFTCSGLGFPLCEIMCIIIIIVIIMSIVIIKHNHQLSSPITNHYHQSSSPIIIINHHHQSPIIIINIMFVYFLGFLPQVSIRVYLPEYGDEQADAGRDCRTRLARSNSQARTGTREYSFFRPQAGLAALPG